MKNVVLIIFCSFLLLLVACTPVDSIEIQEVGEAVETVETVEAFEAFDDEINVEIENEEYIEDYDESFVEEIIKEIEEIIPVDNRGEPALPTLKETKELPECEGMEFNTYPVEMSDVYEISPLGNLAPPGHTFPTEHSFIHLGDYETNLKYPVYAPADVFVTHVSKYAGSLDPWEYTIYFALCKDYVGYYNHVKELSLEFEAMLTDYECEQWTNQDEGDCAKNTFFEIPAGMNLGNVGANQGNFDFGMMDLTMTHEYANLGRYGGRTPHIVCAYEFYPDTMRDVFFNLIERDDKDRCGQTAQDVIGTLQGNWFYLDGSASSADNWEYYLAFVYDNEEPEVQVLSIGGVFTGAGKWEFIPQKSGLVNRDFATIKPSEIVYCYSAEQTKRWRNDPLEEGRILVQLVDGENLLIEYQSGDCDFLDFEFVNATMYSR